MSTAAVSQGFICKLKDRKEVAEGTMAFKPSGWTFKAGQYIDMTLLDPFSFIHQQTPTQTTAIEILNRFQVGRQR